MRQQILTSVVKIGGSVFSLPELPSRLEAFLQWRENQGDQRIVAIVGGGPAADWVRELDRIHSLGETRAHQLALRSLDFTRQALISLTPNVSWVPLADLSFLPTVGHGSPHARAIPILNAREFLDREAQTNPIPQSWSITTDSIAARLAVRLDQIFPESFTTLWLLKSLSLPFSPQVPWNARDAAREGWVDDGFLEQAQSLKNVAFVNFRHPDWLTWKMASIPT